MEVAGTDQAVVAVAAPVEVDRAAEAAAVPVEADQVVEPEPEADQVEAGEAARAAEAEDHK